MRPRIGQGISHVTCGVGVSAPRICGGQWQKGQRGGSTSGPCSYARIASSTVAYSGVSVLWHDPHHTTLYVMSELVVGMAPQGQGFTSLIYTNAVGVNRRMTDYPHKNVHPIKVQGKTISKVFLAHENWKSVKSGSPVPGSKMLSNFRLKAGKQELIVLDNYGNENLPDCIESRMLPGLGKFEYTLAIDTTTGSIYTVVFGIEKRRYIAVICPLMYDDNEQEESYRIPPSMIEKIPTLLNKKRPFWLTLGTDELMSFIDREQGYSWLRKGLQVSFHFEPNFLEVDAHFHRFVSPWA